MVDFKCHITINNQTTSRLRLLKTDIAWGKFEQGPINEVLPKKTVLAFVAKDSLGPAGAEGTVWYQVGDDANNTVKIYWDVPESAGKR